MSRQLWGRLCAAALAGAVITLAPSASAHAAPAQPDTTPVISPAVDSGPSPAVARGWQLTVTGTSVNLRANYGSGSFNWNNCHKNPGPTNCPDVVATMGRNDGIFGHCKKASGGYTWVFASWKKMVGYVRSDYVGPQSSLNRVPACQFGA